MIKTSIYLQRITNLILFQYWGCHGKECALWHVPLSPRKLLPTTGRGALWDEDHHWELPEPKIACLQIIRADAWQDPITTPNWWCFLFFGNTIFTGSRVAKQRKLTFSWLLISMTTLRVCCASNYCNNMPINIQFCLYSGRKKTLAWYQERNKWN